MKDSDKLEVLKLIQESLDYFRRWNGLAQPPETDHLIYYDQVFWHNKKQAHIHNRLEKIEEILSLIMKHLNVIPKQIPEVPSIPEHYELVVKEELKDETKKD